MAEKERNDDNTGKSEGKQGHGKRILLRTFGCQMNVRDSEIICGLLKDAGYKICDSDKDADIIIFNTCSVRKHAEDRVWSLIGSYKGGKVIGLAGCMAQNYRDKAFQRDPGISFVVGTQDIEKIPEIVDQLSAVSIQPSAKSLFERKIWETDGEGRPEEVYHTEFRQDKDHAYVVISEGCSNFCSYCIVPYVRGPLRHRKRADIIGEVRRAAEGGAARITLLGQNVNAYCDGKVDFPGLLKSVNAVGMLKEFDFFTSHPKDAGKSLFEAIAGLDKCAKRLHLPLQSGSDRVLEMMNRGYTVKDYLELADSYRRIVKNGLLTTDIIVGFPGETGKDFESTCALLNKVGFNAAYIFKYSPRPGTKAAEKEETLSRKAKEERHEKILDLQRRISRRLNNKNANIKN